MVLKPEKEKEAEAIFRKWGLDFAIVGETTRGNRFIVRHQGEVMADLPIKELLAIRRRNTSGPSSTPPSRPCSMPMTCRRRLAGRGAGQAARHARPCSKRWVWEQYDHIIGGNTVQRPGGDAAVVRVEDGPKGLALTTDVTPRYCEADAFEGGKQAVAGVLAQSHRGRRAAARRDRQFELRQSGTPRDHGPVRRRHPRHRGGLQAARLPGRVGQRLAL